MNTAQRQWRSRQPFKMDQTKRTSNEDYPPMPNKRSNIIYVNSRPPIKSSTNRSSYCSPDRSDFGQIVDEDYTKEKSDFGQNTSRVSTRERNDFGQYTGGDSVSEDLAPIPSTHTEQYTNLLAEQYGLYPELDPIKVIIPTPPTKETKASSFKDENASINDVIYDENNNESTSVETHCCDDSDIQSEKILIHNATQNSLNYQHLPKSVHISETPRIKKVAEKFSKYKKGYVEIRRLEETVVCVEYDVYEKLPGGVLKPAQIMRTYFSIKTHERSDDVNTDANGDNPLNEISSKIKTGFNLSDDDLKKLTEIEIEIIDDRIDENKPYLKDLKSILKRKNFNSKRNKDLLDLQYLYELAKKQIVFSDICHDLHEISGERLKDIKDLILKRCTSSIHGVSRKKLNMRNHTKHHLSQSIMSDLLQEF